MRPVLRRALLTVTLAAMTVSSALAVSPAAATLQPRVPHLRWASCGPDLPQFQCTTAVVPLDYDRPSGKTTTLAMIRLPAADQAHRIGSVFVNPGGPGGSAVGFVAGAGGFIAEGLQGKFDVVGFDPRGVGASTPLQCFETNEQENAFLAPLPQFPYQRAQERPFFKALNDLTSRCLARGGDIRAQMSTADVARDMDLLRQAVGDKRLTYLGFSYGSYLGNTYANLFPNRVRALVIDGVLEPRLWAAGRHIELDRVSAQRVLQEFFRLCDAAGPACAFHSELSARARYERLAQRLRSEPLITPDGVYSYDYLIADTVGAMYAASVWPDFAAFLDAVADATEGSATTQPVTTLRASLHDQLTSSRADPEPYNNGLDAYFGNHCADAQYPTAFRRWSQIGRSAARGSRSGPYWWWFNSPCATWSTSPDRYTGPWTAKTSAPVLVVGNYYDPATDYQGAVVSDRLLRNSRLLSYAGWGHTAYGTSECATTAINAYLVKTALPPRGKVCPANPNPFTAVSARSARPAPPPIGLPPEWLLR